MVRASGPERLVIQPVETEPVEEEGIYMGWSRVHQNPTHQPESKVANYFSIVKRKKQIPRNRVDLEDVAAGRIHPGLEMVSLSGAEVRGLFLTVRQRAFELCREKQQFSSSKK